MTGKQITLVIPLLRLILVSENKLWVSKPQIVVCFVFVFCFFILFCRETMSAASGDKASSCGCEGGWSLFTCNWRGFQLPAGHCFTLCPPFVLRQHSRQALQSQRTHTQETKEHMVTLSSWTLSRKQWQGSKHGEMSSKFAIETIIFGCGVFIVVTEYGTALVFEKSQCVLNNN